MNWLKNALSKLPHPVRWALTMFIGIVFLILGLIMMITPGPGILFLFLGITILAFELEWARELSKQGQQGLEKLVAKAKSLFKRKK